MTTKILHAPCSGCENPTEDCTCPPQGVSFEYLDWYAASPRQRAYTALPDMPTRPPFVPVRHPGEPCDGGLEYGYGPLPNGRITIIEFCGCGNVVARTDTSVL